MNKEFNILTAKNTFFASLFLAATILFFLAPKAAVNVDEQLHYPHAKKVINWYFTGGEDTSCLETPVTNLKYYGQSVDNLSALINRTFNIDNEFQTRHYIGAFFFLVLLFFAGLVSFQISKSFYVSAITVVSLLFMPRLFGQAFGNLKDIPFATGYVAGVYFIIRYLQELPKPRWSSAIWLGLAIAFTCSVRIGGLILPTYLALFCALFFFMKPFVPKQNVSTKPCLVRLLGQGIIIVSIGYFAGLLFWPFALQDVIRNPLDSLHLMEHYKVSIRQIFESKLVWSTNLPWYYLPKWFFISTPEFVFLGLIFYLVSLIGRLKKQNIKQLFYELFLVFTLLFPLIYVVFIKANLYSGVRQMLFVLPVLAILSSLGFFYVWQTIAKKTIKISVAVLFSLLTLLPLKHQISTFPVDYVYFNSISGGNKNAWGKYEYDYYFHGIKKSSEYLINLIDGKDVIVAGNCNLSNYFEDFNNIKYQYTRYLERSSKDWDYGLFGINYLHPDLLKTNKWQSTEIIKTFYHKQNPVAVLLKRKKKDLAAFSQIESEQFENAEKLLLESIKMDPNNVWLFVQLAKIALQQKDFENFESYLEKGRNIYLTYEPFYLLEAQYLFSIHNFTESKKVLDQLVLINPRYKNAKPLMNAVQEKLKNKLHN